RLHALGHHLRARQDGGKLTAAPELEPHMAVAAQLARAREYEIAEAAEAGERLAPPAHGTREPRDLGKAPRDQRRERVVAELCGFHDAGGNRDDVLQRRADFDTDDVVRP